MRIAFLSVSDDLGGSEMALLEMIRGLRRSKPAWMLHLILPGTGPLFDRAAALGARCEVVPLPASLARLGESAAGAASSRSAASLRLAARLSSAAAAVPGYRRTLESVLRAIAPDLLHTNGLKAHVLGAWAAAPGLRLVWHVHEYISGRPLTRRLMRRLLPRCNAIIANSHSVADDLIRAIGAARPTVIHNAVDLTEFTSDGATLDLDALAGLPPAPPGTVRVGLVATFGRWKGHGVFLRALAEIDPAARVRGYIVGSALYDTAGSQYSRDELTRMARQLGASDRVGFTGFQPAAAAMRSLDIVVHSSTEPEPFGLVIAEAMACGRALTTSGIGGAAELVVPDADALVHTAGDARSLADSIRRLTDPSVRRRLGAAARKAAEERFDPARMTRELVALYASLGCPEPEGQAA